MMEAAVDGPHEAVGGESGHVFNDYFKEMRAKVTNTAAGAIEKAIGERKAQEYTASLLHYLQTGTMPLGFFRSLPTSTQKYYRHKHVGRPGHYQGRPHTPQEARALTKRNKTRIARNRVAKQSRKRNRACR